MPKITVTIDTDTHKKLKWIAENSRCPVSMSYAEDILAALDYSADHIPHMGEMVIHSKYGDSPHICDASGYECKPKTACHRCGGAGVWFGGVDGNIDFKCDPCPAPPLQFTKEGYVILPEISVRQKRNQNTQDNLCTADETLPPINEATGHEWSDT